MKGINVKDLFSIENELLAPLFEGVELSFEVLPKIGEFIKNLGPKLNKDIYEEKGDSI